MQLQTGAGVKQLNAPVTKMMVRLSAAAAAAPGPVVGSSVVTAEVAEPYTTARGTGQQVYSGVGWVDCGGRASMALQHYWPLIGWLAGAAPWPLQPSPLVTASIC